MFSGDSVRVFGSTSDAEIVVPIESQGRFVGALVLLLSHPRTSLRRDESDYLKLLATQASLTYSVSRLRRSEERFRELLNRIKSTENANLLSLGLSHEMKNHLGAF